MMNFRMASLNLRIILRIIFSLVSIVLAGARITSSFLLHIGNFCNFKVKMAAAVTTTAILFLPVSDNRVHISVAREVQQPVCRGNGGCRPDPESPGEAQG